MVANKESKQWIFKLCDEPFAGVRLTVPKSVQHGLIVRHEMLSEQFYQEESEARLNALNGLTLWIQQRSIQ